ncbi:MAG: immunoglobulin domain-containing protein, partial [Limisphaerales bacterium]
INTFYLQGIGFLSANEGWVGGESTTAPYAANFLHTLDGGASWTPAGYNDTRRINRIRFLNSSFGYASGTQLHIYRAPLSIAQQPINQIVPAGTNVIFSVVANGTPPFRFQWQKDAIKMTNATNAFLTLTNVGRVQSGVYTVVVTNAFGTLLSSNATLRVLVPQKIATPGIFNGGEVQFLFGDADGGLLGSNNLVNFGVQASSNLVQWIELTNGLSLTNGLIKFQDANATNFPQRFYRVLER